MPLQGWAWASLGVLLQADYMNQSVSKLLAEPCTSLREIFKRSLPQFMLALHIRTNTAQKASDRGSQKVRRLGMEFLGPTGRPGKSPIRSACCFSDP